MGGRSLGVAMSHADIDGGTIEGVTTLKTAAGSSVGFFGVTGTTQLADAAEATITITWVTISSGFGFQTSDQVVSLIATFKHLQHVLTTLGLWKGSV